MSIHNRENTPAYVGQVYYRDKGFWRILTLPTPPDTVGHVVRIQ